ncbi:M48 family metallopeptidase [Geobacter grbiciae]|uniref:M48 family metallopeptidase n=1 Tax=Geobacter grbiciae TaxID=155042 RepID=UPI001C023F48|nr:SprT family zinc-dependent metalloprotease [Geobacter grbiciae]MBT1073964.1 M48 family metallopeptidase [Geobacter grbiciae]
MSTEAHHIRISGITVEVVRKDIKNLHLGVYPPNGRVRVAAPMAVNDDAVRLAVIGKLGWIKRHRARFAGQERQSSREYVTGESHYLQGRRYRLNVVNQPGPARVSIRNRTTIDLFVPEGSDTARRERIMVAWYRRQLKEQIPPLLEKWEETVGVRAAAWGVKRMKTKWGACNTTARRIWLNLELAKKPAHCLEYIVVHELVHLLERPHSDRFTALMDRFMPQWRLYRDELNRAPLGHEAWGY